MNEQKIDNYPQRKVAQVAAPLIILGVLKGYMKHPLAFLIRSKISFRRFKKTIDIELPKDFVDSAGFVAWLYNRLQQKMDKTRAFEIVRASVLTSGLALQQASFRNVEQSRTFRDLVKYQQLNNKEGTTKLNTMEVVEQSEYKYEFRITRCLFHELFSSLNIPELTTVMCSIDNAIFNSYLPESITFHRNGLGKTMPNGHSYCEFVIENHQD